jgi:hypothetical protein
MFNQKRTLQMSRNTHILLCISILIVPHASSQSRTKKILKRNQQAHKDGSYQNMKTPIDKELILYVQKLSHDLGEDLHPLTPSLEKLDTALENESLHLDKDTILQALDDIEHIVKKHHDKLDENCIDEFQVIKEKQKNACGDTKNFLIDHIKTKNYHDFSLQIASSQERQCHHTEM